MDPEQKDALVACKSDLCNKLYLKEVLVFMESKGTFGTVQIMDIMVSWHEFLISKYE